jgi:hypothetical protein
MIGVCMEVREGAALSRATVQAESIREAVNITRRRYPGREVRVVFPIDPEDFFIQAPAGGIGGRGFPGSGLPQTEGSSVAEPVFTISRGKVSRTLLKH